MGARKKRSVDKVLELSIPERILVVEAIWDSIADEPDSVLTTKAQKEELDHRLSEPAVGVELSEWKKVKGRIQKPKK